MINLYIVGPELEDDDALIHVHVHANAEFVY
jgi:hypothetical protein